MLCAGISARRRGCSWSRGKGAIHTTLLLSRDLSTEQESVLLRVALTSILDSTFSFVRYTIRKARRRIEQMNAA